MPLRSPEDFPVVVNSPCYFGFGDKTRPPEYWSDPALMVKIQEDGFYRHLQEVNDDTVPYFMPWFGTGVLASAFGCAYKDSPGYGEDPAIVGRCIDSVKDIARLKKPRPHSGGWMARVLKTMEHARKHSDLPVGMSDLNSPLSTAAQMCGYENLFIWMYEESEAVHDLMAVVADAFIDWVKAQKEAAGEGLDESNGLQGAWSPKGMGVWLSDDDIVSVGPELYEKFVVPQYSRIFGAFGGGSLHFCGNASHQMENILKIKDLKAVNNSTMYDMEAFSKLYKSMAGKAAIIIQDTAYFDIRGYFKSLFEAMDGRLDGVMIASFVQGSTVKNERGEEFDCGRGEFETCRQIVAAVRELTAERLSRA